MAQTSQTELLDKVNSGLGRVGVGQLYRHYKDPKKFYVVEFVGLLENTEEVCVGYRALYGKGLLWIRTLNDFLAKKEVDGKTAARFRKK